MVDPARRRASALTPLPQRQGLGDDVHEALKKSIMDHLLAPGARLSIDGLARELAVSPTPVREALARLESEGLVTRTALKGYSVSQVLTRAQLEDLFGLRMLLEPWAAGAAAERADEETGRRLTDELASIAGVVELPGGEHYDAYQAFAAHDARFHDLLLATAGNEAVRRAFERTHCHLHIFRLHYTSGIGADAVVEHRAVVDAVLSGDPTAAAGAMRAHLHASRSRLLAAYR